MTQQSPFPEMSNRETVLVKTVSLSSQVKPKSSIRLLIILLTNGISCAFSGLFLALSGSPADFGR